MTAQVNYSREPEDFDYIATNIPCQKACPAGTNVPAYIRALYENDYNASYDINRLVNILPGVLGRICSRPCENLCRHGEHGLGDPVNICHIKRAASDFRNAGSPMRPGRLPGRGFSVAVVGSGPAGLAASNDLAAAGISVTIYESFDKPGGMLRYGIPDFRLPRNILDDEINAVLCRGIALETGIQIGRQLTIEQLLADFDAVLMTAGCYKPNRMNIEGESLNGVYSGLEFMVDICSGKPPEVGKQVLVAGAGFTAFDCARSALRLGAEEVTICLRRTAEDLTVTADEILEAKKEGVKIISLMLARRITGTGKVEAVEFMRTRPGAVRPDGKHDIEIIEGSGCVLPAQTFIVAAGQKPQPVVSGLKNSGTQRGELFTTSVKNVYIAGDHLTGPSTVIEAIAQGRQAAETIFNQLTGTHFRETCIRMEDTQITDRLRPWDFLPRQEMPTIAGIDMRLASMGAEVETGLDRQQAEAESRRCYLCYLHYEIDIARCIYCRYCIDVAPRDCIKLVDELRTNENGAITGFVEAHSWEMVNAVVIDNARCIRCGECVRVCPMDCISVTRVEMVERRAQPEETDA